MKHWLLIAITALSIRGEWSNDPGNPVNLGSGIQPQIVSTSDGGAYVAWLTSGNFHVYLQRLDINGDPQWTPGGILVSDALNSSWIAVFHMNLAVDGEDNAIISTVDTRTGNWEVYAYKMDPDGNAVWNENGLVLSSNGSENISPRLSIEPLENSIIVSWFESTNNSSLQLQMISSTGDMLWGASGISVSTFNASLVSPQSALSSDGHILVQAIKQTGSFPALSSQVIMQKYALEGTAQWGAWLPLADPVGFPLGNWLQDIQPDLNGGAFSSWTEMTSQNQTGKVQSVSDTGTLEWTSATEASTSANNFRVSPRLALANDGSGMYAVWGESDANQINRGILGQRIDTTGTRQWGDGGLAVEPMGLSSFLDINTDQVDDDLLLSYIRQYSFGTMDIFASRLESDGSFAWDTERVSVTNSAAEKSDLNMTRGPGCAFLTWSEAGSIKAHCLLGDGTLGIPVETPQDTLNYFPLLVNSGVVLASEIDTTTFIIVNSTNINGNLYHAFDTYYPGESINQFRIDGNQVKVWDGSEDAVLYDISVPINTTWEFNVGDYGSEITFISRGDTIETEMGVYENCFCFHRFIGADYEFYDWLAEDGGLVQRDVVTIAGIRRYIMIDQLVPVAIEDEKSSTIPGNFELSQNYPNPFNPSTQIQYTLPAQTEVSVVIYDVNGTQVSELQKGFQEAGNYTLQWHAVNDAGSPVPSGLYFCRISGFGLTQTIKMVHLK